MQMKISYFCLSNFTSVRAQCATDFISRKRRFFFYLIQVFEGRNLKGLGVLMDVYKETVQVQVYSVVMSEFWFAKYLKNTILKSISPISAPFH
jgi:hypothetical protein